MSNQLFPFSPGVNFKHTDRRLDRQMARHAGRTEQSDRATDIQMDRRTDRQG